MHKDLLVLWSPSLLQAAHRLQWVHGAFQDRAAQSNHTEISTESKGIYFIQDLIEKQERGGKVPGPR